MPPDIFTGALMALSLIIQRRLTPPMGGLICSGRPGRFAPDWVADLKRNQWPIWRGIATSEKIRFKPLRFPDFKKILCMFVGKGLYHDLIITRHVTIVKFYFASRIN